MLRIIFLFCCMAFGFSLSAQAGLFSSKHNFDYKDGDKPWIPKTDTKVNTSFDQVNDENSSYFKSCDFKDSRPRYIDQTSMEYYCLQANNVKMVAAVNGENKIFTMPATGNTGFYEQYHMINGKYPEFFYTGNEEKWGTKYFLIAFDGREIPTYFPKETAEYLPIWKKYFLSYNQMSEQYYAEHIKVIGTDIYTISERTYFNVIYYFTVDWAQTKLADTIAVNDELNSAILIKEANDDLHRIEFLRNKNKIKPINSIASTGDIENAVEKQSPFLKIDVNQHISLDKDGQLVLKVYGTIDDVRNECELTTILLTTGKIIDYHPTACRVY